MILSPRSARILVASDRIGDARQVVEQLQDDFDLVELSSNSALATKEFEDFGPEVLVLAFNTLEKAQRYCLGVYHQGKSLLRHDHRTIILCNKTEVRTVFDLCKRDYFQDYVLYWPYTHDAAHLAMSVWIAARQMIKLRSVSSPARADLLAHARHLQNLESTLEAEWAEGERHGAAARKAMQQLELEVARSTDDFSQGLRAREAAGWIDMKDKNVLLREIERLKNGQLARTRHLGTASLERVDSWARQLKSRIEPALSGTRAVAEKMRSVRPLVMVVDDDEVIQQLVVGMLEAESYDVLLASNTPDAQRQLREVCPDVILMDIRMPGVDGVSFTRQLKAAPRFTNVKVIMLTGIATREALASSIEAGSAEFVVKPFTRETLLGKLEVVLGGYPPGLS